MVYEKPKMIKNESLFDGNTNRLKHDIVEHFDYQVVTEDVWKYLVSWYDCDFKICRRIIPDGNCLKLDLHPEIHPITTQYCYY
jgi:hypothetical protein